MWTAALVVLLLAPQGRFQGYPEQDALSYRLSLVVDPVAKHLEGTVAYRFRAGRELDRIRLDAKAGPKWSVAFHDAAGRPLAATWDETGVTLALGQRAAAGAEIAFEARLRGLPPDGFYFEPSRHGAPLAFTDHYSIRARGWLPCEDHPGDRASFATELWYPEGNLAVASGAAVADEPAPPARPGWIRLSTATASEIPPYMYAVAVGPYARLEEAGDPRLVGHLIYPEDVGAAKRALTHHAEWIRLMEETFGPLAYAKYLVVQCPTRWGGFEAPGNVQVSEQLFDAPDAGVHTLAHELTHMWFGDAVGYSEWREVWLSEGFASYLGPWLQAHTGGPPLPASMARMRERWLESPYAHRHAVRWDGFAHPDLALNANTYPKGAWVLHMLRGELGDEAFFAALRDYYREHSGSSVATADFEHSIERSTGRELGWFFEQWLDRAGCPALRVRLDGGTAVVEQTQDGAPYRFRLRLGWREGLDQAVERVFEIRERRTELALAEDRVADLVVDPDVELLYRSAE